MSRNRKNNMPAAWAAESRRVHGVRMCKGAFTLIELLVVIAIIGLLISLLAPSLGRARESARAIACLSNKRQVGIAIFMFQSDNNGEFPDYYNMLLEPVWPYQSVWAYLAPYLGHNLPPNAGRDVTGEIPQYICTAMAHWRSEYAGWSAAMAGFNSNLIQAHDRPNPTSYGGWYRFMDPERGITNMGHRRITDIDLEGYRPLALVVEAIDATALRNDQSVLSPDGRRRMRFPHNLSRPQVYFAEMDPEPEDGQAAIVFTDGHGSMTRRENLRFYSDNTPFIRGWEKRN